MWFFSFFVFLPAALAGPDFGRICNPGEKGSPGIKFYLDKERHDTPYPFRYLGCGGEGAHFDTKAETYKMVQLDDLNCNGFSSPAGDCGTGIVLSENSEKEECPDGHYCSMGPFFGVCCSAAVSDSYDENRKALKCPNGTKPYMDPEDKTSVFFGRSCDHKFCPNYSKCVQEEFEAYCCVCNGFKN